MSFPGAQSAGSLGPLPKGWPEPISLPRPLGYRYWYREPFLAVTVKVG